MIPTTDQMDHITPQERNALVGFCEKCGEHFNFQRVSIELTGLCPKCGSKPSEQQGLQITTQRTWTKPSGRKAKKR